MKIHFSLPILALSILGLNSACTQDNTIDTGLSDGVHATTMLGYFESDPYNWDSLRVMIRHAGLDARFNTTLPQDQQITFFAPTNHSIRRYLYQNNLERVADISAEQCRSFLLDAILNERLMLDDAVAGRPSATADQLIGTGGKTYTALSGKDLWIYKFREQYNGVPEAGANRMYVLSPTTTKSFPVGSHDIQTQTGIVHAMIYDYTLGDF